MDQTIVRKIIDLLSPYSNFGMHEAKLTAIHESKEPNKFNPVPHKKEAALIMQSLQKRRARNEK